MPKKEEYENVINRLLGTNIQWSKLKQEELIEFVILLNHPEILMAKLGVTTPEKEVAAEIAKTTTPIIKEAVEMWKSHGPGPLAQLYRKLREQRAAT